MELLDSPFYMVMSVPHYILDLGLKGAAVKTEELPSIKNILCSCCTDKAEWTIE
jgi:hypothetical protein